MASQVLPPAPSSRGAGEAVVQSRRGRYGGATPGTAGAGRTSYPPTPPKVVVGTTAEYGEAGGPRCSPAVPNDPGSGVYA